MLEGIINIKANHEWGHSVKYQPSYQAGYQPSGGPADPALRLMTSLKLGFILDLVSPSQLVPYLNYSVPLVIIPCLYLSCTVPAVPVPCLYLSCTVPASPVPCLYLTCTVPVVPVPCMYPTYTVPGVYSSFP